MLVDLRPLSPPYVVEAVGPPSLEVAFVDGPSGRLLTTLRSVHGVRWKVRRARSLTLPAGSVPDLLVASPAPRGAS